MEGRHPISGKQRILENVVDIFWKGLSSETCAPTLQ